MGMPAAPHLGQAAKRRHVCLARREAQEGAAAAQRQEAEEQQQGESELEVEIEEEFAEAEAFTPETAAPRQQQQAVQQAVRAVPVQQQPVSTSFFEACSPIVRWGGGWRVGAVGKSVEPSAPLSLFLSCLRQGGVFFGSN